MKKIVRLHAPPKSVSCLYHHFSSKLIDLNNNHCFYSCDCVALIEEGLRLAESAVDQLVLAFPHRFQSGLFKICSTQAKDLGWKNVQGMLFL